MSRSIRIRGASARLATMLALLLATGMVVAGSASAATITVTTTADTSADDGSCTLREAIQAATANAASGATAGECVAGEAAPERDEIEFDIGAAGSAQTIAPLTQLPTIDEPVEIDGRNDDPLTQLPDIEIDASAATNAALILSLGADDSHLHHLAVLDGPQEGIRVLNDDNLFERLLVGVDISGADRGNAGGGIAIHGADNTIRESVISGNGGAGIGIVDDSQLSLSTGTTIAGNRIGTGLAGTTARANDGDGIVFSGDGTELASTTIGGSLDPTPGGPCDGDCNLISGNAEDGIDVNLTAAATPLTGLSIRGNHLGSDAAGNAAVPNGTSGIRLRGFIDAAQIRSNLISGNSGDGVDLFPGTSGGPSNSAIAGNLIGVDREGDDPLANGGRGVYMSASVTANQGAMTGNTIGGGSGLTPGGACTGDCNVIGANAIDGITLFRGAGGPVSDTRIIGNHLGAGTSGADNVGNTQSGVALSGGVEGTEIGAVGTPNVISGNDLNGVMALDELGDGNVVEANLIGLASDGIAPLGNGDHGVEVFSNSSNLTVGGATGNAGNAIAHNGGAGVFIGGGSEAIRVLGNAISDNAGLGLDLLPDLLTTGVTPNDGPGDPDTDGGNNFQNFPELATAASPNSSTYVIGELESSPSSSFRIEVFANAAADPSGNGEGEQFVGGFEVATDSGGEVAFAEELATDTPTGSAVTATATLLDGAGNPVETSEFGPNVTEGCDLTGSAAGETLTGSDVSEVICGLGGDDVLMPGGGQDFVVGGDGSDAVSYADSPAGVIVDLGAATAAGAGEDQLREVEDATGSEFNDTLSATAQGSSLTGLGGNDELNGGGGDDTLKSQGGRDDLRGSGGDDVLKAGGGDKDDATGQGGEDVVKGGGGKKDDVRGGGGKDKLDGGGGKKDSCNGGGGKDRKKAPGCEKTKSIP